MCKTYYYVSDAVADIEKLKAQYRELKTKQEDLKRVHNMYDPESGLTEYEWKMKCQSYMWANKDELNRLSKEIIDTRKEIKRLDRAQNLKYNTQNGSKRK